MSAGADTHVPSFTVGPGRSFSPELPFIRVSGRMLFAEELDLAALVVRGMLDRLLPPLARAAMAVGDAGAWKEFGYARAEDFCRERLSRSARWLRRLAFIGRALREWPELGPALTGDDGGAPLGQEQAYQVARVAGPGTVAAWIAFARAVPLRRLREEVRRTLDEGRETPPEAPAPDENEDDAEPTAATDESGEAPVTLRLFVAGPVRACWEEALELHRAVDGGGASVVSFVEALVAEAQAGQSPPDLETDPLSGVPEPRRRGSRSGAREREPIPPADDGDLDTWLDRAQLRELLGLGPALCRAAGKGDAASAVKELEALLEVAERGERILGEILLLLAAQHGFAQLGFDRLESYAEERLGISGATARQRVFLARGLRWHPVWREVYLEGRVSAQKLLILLRELRHEPLDGAAESAWVALAAGATCRRLQDEVRAAREATWFRRAPERPWSRRPAGDRAWRRAQRREYGRTLARLLEAAEELGRAPALDAVLALRLPRDLARAFLVTLERATPPAELVERLGSRPVRPDDDPAQTFSAEWQLGSTSWSLLFLLYGYALEWDRAPDGARRPEEAIYVRDGWRCQAPGCGSRRNLEAHHIVYRSRGGENDPANLITLCRFHHQRGEHGELLAVTGTAPLDVIFGLGRNGIGGTYRNDRRIRDVPA